MKQTDTCTKKAMQNIFCMALSAYSLIGSDYFAVVVASVEAAVVASVVAAVEASVVAAEPQPAINVAATIADTNTIAILFFIIIVPPRT